MKGATVSSPMKWFTVPALLAAAVFGAVVVIPFLPATKSRPDFFGFEIRLATSTAGKLKIYYDIGAGYREADSSQQTIVPDGAPHTYRMTLPAAEYRSIRVDPLDGPGTVFIESVPRIMTQSGRVVRAITFAELKSLQLIETRRERDGGIEVKTTADANDPQLHVIFSPPLVVNLTVADWIGAHVLRALAVFVVVALLFFGIDRAPRIRRTAARTLHALQIGPRRAVAVFAALSVIASAYPIIFLGKSYVSPNFGTTLLYEAFPTLPSYKSSLTAEVNGGDVGATMWHHVPNSFIQRRALLQGELPLWNRYTLTGTPLLGQGQSMFGDPLHFLVVLFGGAAWAWDLKFILAKWLFATGLGLLVLRFTAGGLATRARDPVELDPTSTVSTHEKSPLSAPVYASLIVTAAAPFMGFFLYRINHAAVFSVSYAPWVLYGWACLVQASQRRASVYALAVLFVANLALLNSGTVKEAYVLLLQMNLTGAGLVLGAQTSCRERITKLSAAVWTGLLLVLITMPVWATFLRSLREAYTASTHAAVGQIQPSLLLGAFDELFFRPISQGEIVFNPALNFLFLIGLLYFCATLRLHLANRAVVILAFSALVSAAVVFGVVPPSLLRETPFLAHIGHIENCFLCGLLVLWSVLAGVGFHAAASRLRTPEGRADLIIAGALLLAIVSAWIGFRQAAHRSLYGSGTTVSVVEVGEVIPVSGFVWGSLVALLLASAGVAIASRRSLMRGAVGPASAVVIVLCGLILLWRHGAHTSAMGFETYLLQPPARAPFRAKSAAMDFVGERHRAEPGRLLGLHGNVTPAWNAVHGLEAIYGPDALQNTAVRELIDASPFTWNSAWRMYITSDEATKARPFLDALNVRYYLDLPGNARIRDERLPVVKEGDLNVYESRTAWPRAFFTNRIERYGDLRALMSRILESDGRPFAAVHRDAKLPRLNEASASAEVDSRTVVAATDYRLTENTTSFNIRASGPGIVMLAEGWWPNAFRAYINGRRVPFMRVNHAFKGVWIESAGVYRVAFTYWPKHFTLYLVFAAIGGGLLVVSVFLALRKTRSAATSTDAVDLG